MQLVHASDSKREWLGPSPLRRIVPSVAWWVLALVIAAMVGIPLSQIVRRLVEEGGSGYGAMFDRPDIGRTFAVTGLIGVASALLALVLGVLFAWWVSRLSGRTGRVAAVLPLMALLIPPPVTVLGWIFLLSPEVGYGNQLLRRLPLLGGTDSGPIDIYSVPGIVIVSALFLMPFVFFFAHGAFRSVGPDFENAAALAGASRLRSFFTVGLPLIRPAMVYAAAIVLVLGVGQFTAPLLLGTSQGTRVISTEIYFVTGEYPINYALGSALATPLILLGILVVIMQRRIVGDERRFVVGRDQEMAAETSRWRVVPVAVLGVLLALPLLAVLHMAVSPYWSGELTVSDYTLQNFRKVWERGEVFTALRTSLIVSGLAVAIVVPLTFLGALAILPGSSASWVPRRIIEFASNVPLGIPAVIFGLGALFAYAASPFQLYGTLGIIVVCYVTIMLPFALRMQLAALVSQGPDYWEASRVSGASSTRTVVRIVGPLASSGVLSAAIFTFILCMYEFSSSLMLSSPRTLVMGMLFYRTYDVGDYPSLAVLAVMMVAVASVIVCVGLLTVGRRTRRLAEEVAR